MHDGRPLALKLEEHFGWGFAIGYVVVSLILNYGVSNLIAAIFVENTISAAHSNQEKMRRRRATESRFAARLMHQLMEKFSEAAKAEGLQNHEVSPQVFADVMKDPETQRIFEQLDIAEDDREDLFQILDVDGNRELTLNELTVGILKLRGKSRRSDALSSVLILRSMQKASRKFYLTTYKEIADLRYSQEQILLEVRGLGATVPTPRLDGCTTPELALEPGQAPWSRHASPMCGGSAARVGDKT